MGSVAWGTAGTYSWTVPSNVTSVQITAYGANAGITYTTAPRAGKVTGSLAVTPGEVLTITVGGQGALGVSTGAGGAGGYNGGGNGGAGVSGKGGGDGGAGASDVRQGGTGLGNRVCVAGGSGGGCLFAGQDGGWGGNPGTVGLGLRGGGGGTTGGGGAAGGGAAGTGVTAGSSGQGGTGGTNAANGGSGGGGGGYFGGGGGNLTGGTGADGSGGGGGANYVGGLTSSTSITDATGYFGSGLVQFNYNTAPNAPTLTGPPNNKGIDQTAATTFTWTFSDSDPGDTQSSADFRWRVGAGAWTTVTAAASTAQSYTAAANAFSSQTGNLIEWQVRNTDSHGAVGPWSTSLFFTPYAPPTAPTITPTPVINSNTVSVHVTHATSFTQFEVKVVNDVAGAPGSTIYTTNAPAGSYGPPGPTSATTSPPPYSGFVNGTKYHVLARIASPDGVWSAYADSGAITASIGAAPLAPTAVVTPVPGSGTVSVAITNPGSDPNPPNHNDVYRTDLTHSGTEIRIATNVPLNSTYTDYLAAANTNYRYRIVAVTNSGGSASSP